MGYRSIVGIAVPTEKLNKWLEEQNDPEANEFIKSLWVGERTVEDLTMTYLFDNYTKWYVEEDPIIERFSEFLDELDVEEHGFIRIGEDLDDITYEGMPYVFGLHVVRNVELPELEPQNNRTEEE